MNLVCFGVLIWMLCVGVAVLGCYCLVCFVVCGWFRLLFWVLAVGDFVLFDGF